MKGNHRVAKIIGLLVLAVALYYFGKPKPSPEERADPAPPKLAAPGNAKAPTLPSGIAFQKPRPETLAKVPSHPLAISFGSDPKNSGNETDILLEIFESYRSHFGTFPTGEDNPQFMHALMGANPGRLPIFPLTHPRLSEKGALLDVWNSPFIFHLISRDHIEIRSPGPDREIYTEDDILTTNRPRAEK